MAESPQEKYFDNAATTPLDPRVLREMMPYLEFEFGNAHSLHSWGRRAERAVETARSRVAELIGAEDPSQLVFTSGATESNNWVAARAPKGAWQSPFEHSSMRESGAAKGFGMIPNDGLRLHPPTGAKLLSVMSVNNEIGSRWDVREFAGDRLLHSDITQQVGKLPTEVAGLDFASMSAHKFYGPKGVGALYVATGLVSPFIVGGEQESGRRAGTSNVPAIVGMGAAAAIAGDNLHADLVRVGRMRDAVIAGLEDSGARVNGMGAPSGVSPYILSLSFEGVEGETLVIEADRAGFGISAGAACSSRSTEPSHVLTALGLEESWLRGTIRISFGRFNSEQTADELSKFLRSSVEKLRSLK
jgi:cysteine desulfurase